MRQSYVWLCVYIRVICRCPHYTSLCKWFPGRDKRPCSSRALSRVQWAPPLHPSAEGAGPPERPSAGAPLTPVLAPRRHCCCGVCYLVSYFKLCGSAREGHRNPRAPGAHPAHVPPLSHGPRGARCSPLVAKEPQRALHVLMTAPSGRRRQRQTAGPARTPSAGTPRAPNTTWSVAVNV